MVSVKGEDLKINDESFQGITDKIVDWPYVH